MRIRQNRFVVAGIVDPGSSVAVVAIVRAGDSMVEFRSPTIHNLSRSDREKWGMSHSGERTRPRVLVLAPPPKSRTPRAQTLSGTHLSPQLRCLLLEPLRSR